MERSSKDKIHCEANTQVHIGLERSHLNPLTTTLMMKRMVDSADFLCLLCYGDLELPDNHQNDGISEALRFSSLLIVSTRK